jgi:hypothetical protein
MTFAKYFRKFITQDLIYQLMNIMIRWYSFTGICIGRPLSHKAKNKIISKTI